MRKGYNGREVFQVNKLILFLIISALFVGMTIAYLLYLGRTIFSLPVKKLDL